MKDLVKEYTKLAYNACMSQEIKIDRKEFLRGVGVVGLKTGEYFVKQTNNHEQKTAFGLEFDPKNVFMRGEMSLFSAFSHFKSNNGVFYRTYPNIPFLPAYNWGISRLMEAAIRRESARAHLDPSYKPMISSHLLNAMNSLPFYVKIMDKNQIAMAELPGSLDGHFGSIYLDDNAWILLNYLDIYDMVHDQSILSTAKRIFYFEVSNWDRKLKNVKGGIPWKEQIPGETNHDKNVVSNATVAMAGYRLYQITSNPIYLSFAKAIHTFVMKNFVDEEGSVFDHIDGAGNLDKTFWTYTAGLVIGMNRLKYAIDKDPETLSIAVKIARKALDTLNNRPHAWQPPEFNAIFFHQLQLLIPLVEDEELVSEISQTAHVYQENLWLKRGKNLLFPFPEDHRYLHRIHQIFPFVPEQVDLIHQAAVASMFFTFASIQSLVAA